MLYKLSAPVISAVSALAEKGHRAYLVGGCVRDIIRGEKPHDYDIAVPCPPSETAACFEGRTLILDGLKHGTVAVMIGGEKIEITTFRSDGGYTDGRHPDKVRFVSDILSDLSRRDFTINAMAVPCRPGDDHADTDDLIDPFGGRDDIENRTIRCVGDADTRFAEDGLRILRALRFASSLGYAIAEETSAAAVRCVSMLENISRERIADEMYRIVTGGGASETIGGYPGIIEAAVGAPPRDISLISLLPRDPLLRMIILFGGDTPDVLRRLKRPKAEISSASRICSALSAPSAPDSRADIHRLLIRLGEKDFAGFIALSSAKKAISEEKAEYLKKTAEKLIAGNMPMSVSDLALSGRRLIALGYSGTETGEAKKRLLEAVIEGKAENTEESLMNFLTGI